MKKIERKTSVLGISGSLLVWFCLVLFFSIYTALVKPKKYKSVQLRLENFQQKSFESEGAASSQSESSPQSGQAFQNADANLAQSSVQKVERAVEKSSSVKKADSVQKSKPQEAQVLQQDTMDIFKNQTASAKASKKTYSEKDFDAMFGDAPSDKKTLSPTKKIEASSESSLSGVAGKAGESGESVDSGSLKSESVSSSSVPSKKIGTASESTSGALGKIASADFSSAGNGIKSNVKVSGSLSSDGKFVFQMSDGTSRALLNPKEPKLILSREAASQIDASRTVTITFSVASDGSVFAGEIRIPATIPSLVRSEVVAQIAQWRFTSGSGKATAVFEYTIQK